MPRLYSHCYLTGLCLGLHALHFNSTPGEKYYIILDLMHIHNQCLFCILFIILYSISYIFIIESLSLSALLLQLLHLCLHMLSSACWTPLDVAMLICKCSFLHLVRCRVWLTNDTAVQIIFMHHDAPCIIIINLLLLSCIDLVLIIIAVLMVSSVLLVKIPIVWGVIFIMVGWMVLIL